MDPPNYKIWINLIIKLGIGFILFFYHSPIDHYQFLKVCIIKKKTKLQIIFVLFVFCKFFFIKY